jgi:hypothetical protein
MLVLIIVEQPVRVVQKINHVEMVHVAHYVNNFLI